MNRKRWIGLGMIILGALNLVGIIIGILSLEGKNISPELFGCGITLITLSFILFILGGALFFFPIEDIREKKPKPNAKT